MPNCGLFDEALFSCVNAGFPENFEIQPIYYDKFSYHKVSISALNSRS
jgi:hypothetical protein